MGEEDPLPLFISKKCIHLNTWVFDKHLGNRDDIGVVFYIYRILIFTLVFYGVNIERICFFVRLMMMC